MTFNNKDLYNIMHYLSTDQVKIFTKFISHVNNSRGVVRGKMMRILHDNLLITVTEPIAYEFELNIKEGRTTIASGYVRVLDKIFHERLHTVDQTLLYLENFLEKMSCQRKETQAGH